MKLNQFLKIGFLIAGIISFSACTKEGPIGPKGEQGVQGNQGEQGNAGAEATSYKFLIPINTFYLNSSNNSYEATTVGYAPSNMYIGPYDDVSVYFYNTDGEYALPYTEYFNTGTASNHHHYKLTDLQKLRIIIRNSTGGLPYSNMTSNINIGYRVVVIPGYLGKKVQRPDGVDFSNYLEVKAHYNLPD